MTNYEYLVNLPLKAFAKELPLAFCSLIPEDMALCHKDEIELPNCYLCAKRWLESEHIGGDINDVRIYQG